MGKSFMVGAGDIALRLRRDSYLVLGGGMASPKRERSYAFTLRPDGNKILG